jgi:hypothetical protein
MEEVEVVAVVAENYLIGISLLSTSSSIHPTPPIPSRDGRMGGRRGNRNAAAAAFAPPKQHHLPSP